MSNRIVVSLIAMLVIIGHNNIYAQSPENFRFNQLGFYPNAQKIVIVTGNVTETRFYLLSVPSNDTVARYPLTDTMSSQWSSTNTRIADFSFFQKTGKYKLYVPGVGSSSAFSIDIHAQHSVAVASLKGFYYQRVSMPLEEKYAGKWARPAGHPDTEVLIHPSAASDKRPAGTVISSPGGWYDAGDYNKYIVNSGISMGTLLSAYEDFPAYFKALNTNIPESRDAVPDILNEILVNLRWMLTMQDPNDGGVYNKCTNAEFDGMVMPGVTKLPRYVVQKGTAATLDFAAVTAQAARILKAFNKQLPGLSDSCKAAAIKAWQWALQNPKLQYNQNINNTKFEPKVNTGGYGDFNFTDEWFWAACELFVTTNDSHYADTIKSRWTDNISIPSWNNVRILGYYTLLRSPKAISPKSGIDYNNAKTKITTFAIVMLMKPGDQAYRTVIGSSRGDFIWGSNSVAMNQSILLINAYLLTKDAGFLNPALDNLDYVLGRNTTGYCFVTGLGTKSTMHPHHRPSVADGIEEPVPGLLAGGPNPGQQDRCPGYPSRLPAESYLDADCSYASNEIAINWNAPLVYVANALEALQKSMAIPKIVKALR